ncbi:MAG: cation diffusion facilitator family transporter, partial [Desulfomonilaceae bacterium]
MEHDSHNHDHPRLTNEKKLGLALALTLAYMIAEAVGGFVFNSLALLADSGHMLSDATALGISWLAIRIGKKLPTDRHTFGFKRTEIIAALVNGLALWFIVAIIYIEAFQRFYSPVAVQGHGMLLVAVIGLLVNLLMAFLLYRSASESINIRAAFLHVVSDALGSLGAIIAGVIIIYTQVYWVDPLISLLIGILILYSSWDLIKESFHILMEGAPA